MTPTLATFLIISAALFSLGLLAALSRRHAIFILIGIEMMLAAAGLNFITFWRFGPQVAIRMGDWKLVKGAGNAGVQGIERSAKSNLDGAELYNLRNDIGEATNLAVQEPARVRQLTDAWNQWNVDNVDARWTPDRGPRNPKKNQKKKNKQD